MVTTKLKPTVKSEPVSKSQLRRIHMMLDELGLADKDTKAAIIKEYSIAGHTSSKLLTFTEAEALINHLGSNTDVEKCQKQRSTLLSLGYKLMWDRPSKASKREGITDPKQINKYHVEQWCLSKYSPTGKAFNEMNAQELNRTVSALRMYKQKETSGK